MKSIHIILAQSIFLLVAVGLISGQEAPKQAQTQQNTQISDDTLDRAIRDPRYFNRQFSCLAGEGPCDPVGRRLKAAVPLVVRGLGCPKCTPKEEEQMKRVVSYVQRSHPDKWQKLIKKYGN